MKRRSFIAATAASAVPSVIFAQEETPVEKVWRLVGELEKALDIYAEGTMHAVVYPASEKIGAKLVVTNMFSEPKVKARARAHNLHRALSELYPHRQVTHYETLTDEGCTLVFTTGEA